LADVTFDELSAGELPAEAHPTATGIPNEKLSMWVFLASDCLLFGGMISTYLVYKNRPGEIEGLAGSDLKVSELFDIPFTSMTSFILLMSSLTMVLSVNAIVRKDVARMRLWLVATSILGGLFLGGQVYEFTEFVNHGLGFTTNVASSAFFGLTGLHGVHVAAGVIMLLVTTGLSFRRRIHPEAVEVVGLYWHFVDIVWVLIFTVVYLIP